MLLCFHPEPTRGRWLYFTIIRSSDNVPLLLISFRLLTHLCHLFNADFYSSKPVYLHILM